MTENADRLYERLLVLRCQAGDAAAFAELVERYQPRLRYYLRKMLFGASDPDDVLQEVWLDVFRAIPRLNEVGAFRAWLYRIARDRAMRVLRKRRVKYEPIDEDEMAEVEQADEIFATEEAQRVHIALHQLAAAHREVLVLRYIEDMSYEEIARIVNSQIGTVRSRLHYAKRALRTEIEKDRQHER